MSKLTFGRNYEASLKKAEVVFLAAPLALIKKGWLKQVAPTLIADHPALQTAAKDAKPGDTGAIVTTLVNAKKLNRAIVAVLPDKVSRHNCAARHEAIASCAGRASFAGQDKVLAILGLDEPTHYLAAANALGRKLPLYTRKDGKKACAGSLEICAADAAGKDITASKAVRETVAAARWAAMSVDMPPAELNTATFVREARKLVRGLKHVRVSEIVGPKLLEKKMGGLHAVGRCAKVAPRLLILDYKPPGAKKCYAMVGKGVIYDTGGLSLKGTAGMSGMKGDMGGGAATTGAFRALAGIGGPDRIICAVGLVENAIGPDAYRNDDILTMHSKHTVEVNNTDAEGRIVLGDAVSYIARSYKPQAIIDAATLTGAQLISSGLRHGSIVTNRGGLEQRAIDTGRQCGDLSHALLFAPEFYQAQFASKVADMRNSVANRMDAQSSCAGQFIYAQIDDLDIPWLHLDLAGPAWREGRGTGYGVALMSQLISNIKAKDLAADS